MSDDQAKSPKKAASSKLGDNKNAFGVVFKSAEQKYTWHKNRVIMIEDVLIDLCCAKSLTSTAYKRGRGVRLLNEQIAQFSLQAMHFCKWKNVNMSVDFTDKVAQRYTVLSRRDCTMEDARDQVTKTQEYMEKLARGVGLRQIFGEQGGSAEYLNIRIAIFGTQALSTLKGAGVEKDVVFEAMAKMMAGMDADQACQEAVAENEEKLKAKNDEVAAANAGEFLSRSPFLLLWYISEWKLIDDSVEG